MGPGATELCCLLEPGVHVSAGNAVNLDLPDYHYFYVRKENDMSETRIKLALSYTQQADILRKSGDLKPAIESYQKAAAIYLELSQEEPSVLEMLAQTIESAAVTYKDAGDFENAKETQAEAVKVREQMARLEA